MPHWRSAQPSDDETIVAMCMDLYAGNPPAGGVAPGQVRATLQKLREEPVRGRALVLEHDGRCGGYALLVSFWSNELGGEICTIDELYLIAGLRGQGHGTALLTALRSKNSLWPGRPVAFELEVSPANPRARALYQRLGFRDKRNTTMRLVQSA